MSQIKVSIKMTDFFHSNIESLHIWNESIRMDIFSTPPHSRLSSFLSCRRNVIKKKLPPIPLEFHRITGSIMISEIVSKILLSLIRIPQVVKYEILKPYCLKSVWKLLATVDHFFKLT